MTDSNSSTWKGLTHSDVGLKDLVPNGGLNACLQLLLHTPRFILPVMSVDLHNACQDESCLWCLLRVLINDMNSKTRGETVSLPTGLYSRHFIGLGGDPFQYLQKICCTLSHELCEVNPDMDLSVSEFLQFLHGSLEKKRKCSECGKETDKSLPQVGLHVLIDEEVISCQEAVERFLSSRNEDDWCAECNATTGQTILSSCFSASHLLCLKFSRFTADGRKKGGSVSVDMDLQLPLPGAKYKFAGCILHEGENSHSGRYMALVRCPSGSFTLLNDGMVSPVRQEYLQVDKSVRKKIYIVMYERQGNAATEKPVGDSALNTSVKSTHGAWTETTFPSTFPWEVQLDELVPSTPSKKAEGMDLSLCSTHSSWLVTPQKNVTAEDFAAFYSPKTQQQKVNNENEVGTEMKLQYLNSTIGNKQETVQSDAHISTFHGSDTSYESILELEPPKTKKKVACRVLDLDWTPDEEVAGQRSGFSPGVLAVPPLIMVRYEACSKMPGDDFKYLTGVSQDHFEVLFELIGGDYVVNRLKYEYDATTPQKMMPHKKLSAKDRLFMMLLRMRRGPSLRELGILFRLSESQCSVICLAMMRTTYETLKCYKKAAFISAKKQKKNMPAPFKPYKNLRVIIDAAEFEIQRPSDFQQQGNTYSDYKSRNTEKYLIGISCHGSIIYCSDGYEGHISDNDLVKKCGILDYLTEGDAVMVDRGFKVAAELAERGVRLIRPPDFEKKRQFFTAGEEIFTRQTASARIYVEHAIKSIKDWKLIRYRVPMTLHDILPQLVYIAAFLSNFDVPFLQIPKTS